MSRKARDRSPSSSNSLEPDAIVELLLFQLQAPLAAWGTTAVGEERGTYEYPSESALVGLLSAALGVRRDDERSIAAIRDGYAFAVGIQSTGALLRDYHTAQVPGRVALKGRPHATRRDELGVPKHELNTILSAREYRQDAAWLVAAIARPQAPHPLETIAEHLRTPKFILYLGRKSCPPGAPFNPMILGAATAIEGMHAYRAAFTRRLEQQIDSSGRLPLEPMPELIRFVWSEGIEPGVVASFSVPRKDRVIRRGAWQFADRTEHVAILAPKEQP